MLAYSSDHDNNSRQPCAQPSEIHQALYPLLYVVSRMELLESKFHPEASVSLCQDGQIPAGINLSTRTGSVPGLMVDKMF